MIRWWGPMARTTIVLVLCVALGSAVALAVHRSILSPSYACAGASRAMPGCPRGGYPTGIGIP